MRLDAFNLSDEQKIQAIENDVKSILTTLGLDLTDDSLKGTPKRVAKMFVSEIFGGLHPQKKPSSSTFENKYKYNEMLVEKNITVYSTCEHHLLPIVGKAHVAYISNGPVVGLSKMNRIVDYYSKRTPRPRPLPAEERRAATVDAVIELAATRDPGEITTTVIAQHMGVTQGALFRHFPTKDAILEAVMGWVADRLLARVDRAAASAPSATAALEAVFKAHTGFVAEHPGVPRMIFGELQRSGSTATKRMVATLVRHYGERLRALLETGCRDREFRPDLDIGAAATLFLGSAQGLVIQALFGGDVQAILRDAPRVFSVYLRGISRG